MSRAGTDARRSRCHVACFPPVCESLLARGHPPTPGPPRRPTLSRNSLTSLSTIALLSTTSAYAESIDWLAPAAPKVCEVETIEEVSTHAYVGRDSDLFTPSTEPMWFIPMASSGKNCNNPYGFPSWRYRWDPSDQDVAGRPPALTGIFHHIDNAWDQGYRRFMFHRFGGDQAGGAYSAAQWWTFTEEQRFWFMRDDFDEETGEPMGLTAYITQKKAEHPEAEFHIYLGFLMLAVDSLLNENPPYSHTMAHYAECDPGGEDPHNLIPEGIEQHEMRTICLGGDDDVGRTNQLWLTLGAYIAMGFDGAYYDALGSGDGTGALCAGDVARLPQYASTGFRMGVEPMVTHRAENGYGPIHEYGREAPSVSTLRYLKNRMRLTENGLGNTNFDLRGTGHEASVIITDHDWDDDPSVGSQPESNDLTIERLFQLVRHGYTPMGFSAGSPVTRNGIAMITGVGRVDCPADINFDGLVNTQDLLTFIDRFLNPIEMINGQRGIYHADYADDDELDLRDINGFIGAYLAGCE